jgi:hypothetical protein
MHGYPPNGLNETRMHNHGASIMLNNNSPLESLAAFAITFAVGVLSTVALGKYIEKVRRDAVNAANGASQPT